MKTLHDAIAANQQIVNKIITHDQQHQYSPAGRDAKLQVQNLSSEVKKLQSDIRSPAAAPTGKGKGERSKRMSRSRNRSGAQDQTPGTKKSGVSGQALLHQRTAKGTLQNPDKQCARDIGPGSKFDDNCCKSQLLMGKHCSPYTGTKNWEVQRIRKKYFCDAKVNAQNWVPSDPVGSWAGIYDRHYQVGHPMWMLHGLRTVCAKSTCVDAVSKECQCFDGVYSMLPQFAFEGYKAMTASFSIVRKLGTFLRPLLHIYKSLYNCLKHKCGDACDIHRTGNRCSVWGYKTGKCTPGPDLDELACYALDGSSIKATQCVKKSIAENLSKVPPQDSLGETAEAIFLRRRRKSDNNRKHEDGEAATRRRRWSTFRTGGVSCVSFDTFPTVHTAVHT